MVYVNVKIRNFNFKTFHIKKFNDQINVLNCLLYPHQADGMLNLPKIFVALLKIFKKLTIKHILILGIIINE